LSNALSDGLLAKHEVIRTDKIERFSEALLKTCRGRVVSVNCDDRPFFGQMNRVKFERVSLGYCALDADFKIEFPEAPWYRYQICLSGGGEMIIGRKAVPLSDVAACVAPPGTNITNRFGAGYRHLLLLVDPTALQRKLEAFVGTSLPGPIEFQPAQPLVAPRSEMLRRSALFFASEIENFEIEACRLARGEFEQALLAAILSGSAHNYSYLLEASSPGLTPRQVWLAEAFIEANWDKPLTIEALSQAVGVGARSIFKAFKDYRGYSPKSFLRDVRLRRARELLRVAEPGVSVAAVAYRCGFQNHGYFAREYRARFGETPSATLGRGRDARLG